MMLDQSSMLSTRVDVIKFLIERDGDFCYLCRGEFYQEHEDHWSDYTIDHVLPKSRGGLDHVDNYKLAHFPCNQEKDDRLWLPDGTLEPKRNSRRPKMPKAERPQVCETCMNGRMLRKDAVCHSCGHEAGPPKWPWYAKRASFECKHDETNWCWSCCGPGTVPRTTPYIV